MEYVLIPKPLTVLLCEAQGCTAVIKVRTVRWKDYLGLSKSRPRIITRDLRRERGRQWNQRRRCDKGSRAQNLGPKVKEYMSVLKKLERQGHAFFPRASRRNIALSTQFRLTASRTISYVLL